MVIDGLRLTRIVIVEPYAAYLRDIDKEIALGQDKFPRFAASRLTGVSGCLGICSIGAWSVGFSTVRCSDGVRRLGCWCFARARTKERKDRKKHPNIRKLIRDDELIVK